MNAMSFFVQVLDFIPGISGWPRDFAIWRVPGTVSSCSLVMSESVISPFYVSDSSSELPTLTFAISGHGLKTRVWSTFTCSNITLITLNVCLSLHFRSKYCIDTKHIAARFITVYECSHATLTFSKDLDAALHFLHLWKMLENNHIVKSDVMCTNKTIDGMVKLIGCRLQCLWRRECE